MRGVTPALSARRRPLHRRLAESGEPTASPRRSPETDFNIAAGAHGTARAQRVRAFPVRMNSRAAFCSRARWSASSTADELFRTDGALGEVAERAMVAKVALSGPEKFLDVATDQPLKQFAIAFEGLLPLRGQAGATAACC
jgi:hypothetical protein